MKDQNSKSKGDLNNNNPRECRIKNHGNTKDKIKNQGNTNSYM